MCVKKGQNVEFDQQLNIMSTKQETNHVFNNINWTKNNLTLSRLNLKAVTKLVFEFVEIKLYLGAVGNTENSTGEHTNDQHLPGGQMFR